MVSHARQRGWNRAFIGSPPLAEDYGTDLRGVRYSGCVCTCTRYARTSANGPRGDVRYRHRGPAQRALTVGAPGSPSPSAVLDAGPGEVRERRLGDRDVRERP